MARPKSLKPAYCLHKSSGRAYVAIDGKPVYLGKHGTQASRDAYDRRIGEWLARGRTTLPKPQSPPGTPPAGLTVFELIAQFWHHARQAYRNADGSPAGELDNFRLALRPLKRLYGPTLASDFGPLNLKVLRAEMLKPSVVTIQREGKTVTSSRMGWSRTYCNRQVARIRQVFKWATENALVPPSVITSLQAVAGLRRGQCDARETEGVAPVPEAFVDAAKKHLSRQLAAVVDLQLYTAARPGEILAMRGVDLDTSGDVWVYKPGKHKTAHHGINRVIRIGPKAKAVLSPLLKPDLQAFIFCPVDAERERLAARTTKRKTPKGQGNRVGTNRVKRRRRPPGERYTVHGYRTAIKRACLRADAEAHKLKPDVPANVVLVPEWSPGQLRHNAATRLREEFGIDVAQVILGHRVGSKITEVYAVAPAKKANDVIARIG